MYEVVLLTLGAAPDDPVGCGSGAGCAACLGGGAAGVRDSCAAPAGANDACAAPAGTRDNSCTGPTGRDDSPRVPVLSCADALSERGARVEMVTARSDAEIDTVLARLDAPPRPDGLTWPDNDSKTRLVVAAASDGQLRAVLRRMVRRYSPPPSRRPADLAANRTVPDLPPIGVLPLDPGGSTAAGTAAGEEPGDLAGRLGLPRQPADVAEAVLTGRVRRLDLLRNDGGSVTLDGALLGGADEAGNTLPWRGRVEVDDAVLSTGDDPLLACAVGNAGGYAVVGGVPMLTQVDPADGVLEVAVAVPVVRKARLRRTRVGVEVRRARGRAVAVVPRDGEVPYLDDGVASGLGRKRSWWIEPGAWAVYDR